VIGGAIALAVCVACALMVGCKRSEPEPPPEPEPAQTTLEQMVAALEEEGLAYEVSETAFLATIQAQGLRLTGPDLHVEVYRVEGEQSLALAAAASARAASDSGRRTGVQMHLDEPFFIVVRREPTPGHVVGILAALPKM
jgi:hypothetical protein